MKLISPHEYSDLRSELNEFVVLCKTQNYRPVQEDFHDIIQFLLINHTGVGHMCESYESNPDSIVNHLFESFTEDIESIDEYTAFKGDSTYDNAEDFKTATGLVKTGAMAAGGLAIAGALGASQFVTYLFKKGKVKKMVQKELDGELNKLAGYEKLTQMKKKLGDLKGEEVGQVDYPGMAEGPALPEKPEDDSKK